MGREQVLGSLARLSGRQTPAVAIGCAAVLTLMLGLPLLEVEADSPGELVAIEQRPADRPTGSPRAQTN
jgi:hypothetical protein